MGYLKSRMNLLEGDLYLTSDKLILKSHTPEDKGMGRFGFLFKKKVEEKDHGIILSFDDILKISRGKHGMEKNVLEIKTNDNQEYRIIVKDYNEWEKEIKAKIG